MHLIDRKTRTDLEDALILFENPQRAIATGKLAWSRALAVVRLFAETLLCHEGWKDEKKHGEYVKRLRNRKRPAYILGLFDPTIDALLPLSPYIVELEKHLSELDQAFDDETFQPSLNATITKVQEELKSITSSSVGVREKIKSLAQAGQQGSIDLENDRSMPATEDRFFLAWLTRQPVWVLLKPLPEDALKSLRSVLE